MTNESIERKSFLEIFEVRRDKRKLCAHIHYLINCSSFICFSIKIWDKLQRVSLSNYWRNAARAAQNVVTMARTQDREPRASVFRLEMFFESQRL